MAHSQHPILIVEDSDEDFFTTERILKKFGRFPIARCSEGAEVLEHLQKPGSVDGDIPARVPSLILLDLNLPGKKDGRSVLLDLKSSRRYRGIPVVIMTTSSNPQDVRHCFDHGAAGYMVKPVNLDKFVESMASLVKYWFETTALPTKGEDSGHGDTYV